MRRLSFNDAWAVRPKVSQFAEQLGPGHEWTAVTLPHDAQIGTTRAASAPAAGGYFPGGVWEYRRELELAAEDEGNVVVLEFEGVYRDALVHVNGSLAAHRPYGYSNFAVQIDHLLHVGADNEILVDARAHEDSRWYSGAGMFRNVWLVRSGRVHLPLDGIVVRTPEIDDQGALVAVATDVCNQGTTRSEAVLHTEIVDASGAVIATDTAPVTTFPGETLTARQRIFVPDARRWGPDDPYLYTCRVTLRSGDDALNEGSTTFGIRSLSLDAARGLRVNGEPVKLRGACVHHDNGPIGAATIDRAEERRVELLKAAGFNALRSAHQPMSKAMLDACDRLGMLVMDEAFDMWGRPKTNHDHALRVADWWEADLESMVRKDLNHPSVLFYSIGNEIPDGSTLSGLHVGRAMAEKIRTLDGTRFVTQAVTGMLIGGPGLLTEIRELAEQRNVNGDTGVNTAITNIFDVMAEVMASESITEKTWEAFSYLDVAGYNYMDTRFDEDGKRFPNRVVVATETHPSTIDTGWAGVTRNAHVIGDFTWTGWDYLGEIGIGRVEYGSVEHDAGFGQYAGPFPWLTAWCGDIDITGHRRPQSYYREIVFGLRTDPYVAVQRPEHHGLEIKHATPWSWHDVVSTWTWAGHEGEPVTVEVYADAEEVELLVNGTSIGRQPAGPDHHYRAAFETTYEPGELVAVAWQGDRELGRMVLRSASGAVVLDARADRNEIDGGPTDLAYVELRLVDANGVVDTGADRVVTVEIDGPGVLQGLASANPCTEEPFTDAKCTTFDGRALAVVRPTGPGTITVTATAEGCEPQQVRIDAR